jgi:hypothetical protein
LAPRPHVEAIFLKHAQARSKSAESARQLNKQNKVAALVRINVSCCS